MLIACLLPVKSSWWLEDGNWCENSIRNRFCFVHMCSNPSGMFCYIIFCWNSKYEIKNHQNICWLLKEETDKFFLVIKNIHYKNSAHTGGADYYEHCFWSKSHFWCLLNVLKSILDFLFSNNQVFADFFSNLEVKQKISFYYLISTYQFICLVFVWVM